MWHAGHQPHKPQTQSRSSAPLALHVSLGELKKPSHHVRTALLAFQALSAARGAGRRLVCALVSCVGKVLGSQGEAVASVIIYRTLAGLLPHNYDPDKRSLR